MSARCCVVICYWTGRHPRPLFNLLRQMQRIPAGELFEVLVVSNGGDERPLTIPVEFETLSLKVLNRANKGWNLGAWEAGWRHAAGCEYYLFLQAECVIKFPGWISRFVRRMEIEPAVGLLGERLMWQGMSWDYVREATRMDLEERGRPIPEGLLQTIDSYRRILRENDIDHGELGTHLVSIILFARRTVLQAIGGIPQLGETYIEAVSSEIGLSRRVLNAGYRICQLGDEPFFRIGHTQWMRHGRLAQLIERIRNRIHRSAGWH